MRVEIDVPEQVLAVLDGKEPRDVVTLGAGLSIIQLVYDAVRPFQEGDRVKYGASTYEIRYIESGAGRSTQYVCLITEGERISDASGLQVFWDDQFRDAKRVDV